MKLDRSLFLLVFSLLLLLLACDPVQKQTAMEQSKTADREELEQQFINTLQKHLDAVSNRDLTTLRGTMSPDNKMTLILPANETITTVDSFMSFHTAWFQDTTWTFETKILDAEIGRQKGFAVTEVIYREPARSGPPYFNRMTVTYGLERIDRKWYIIMDHASSIEKSTDAIPMETPSN